MKRPSILACLIATLLLASCISNPTQQVSNTMEPTKNVIDTPTLAPVVVDQAMFKNVLIFAPQLQKSVQLSDGKWSETQSDGSVQTVMLDDHFAAGDLNSDGVEDAAVLVTESMSGTGTFYSLVVFVSKNGGFQQTADAFVDDRAVIHTLEIMNGEIILNANVHGPNDAMVDPTVNLSIIYRLIENKLYVFRQTQQLSDGKIREINIISPDDFTEVSGYVMLNGTMPIAPFENTLLVKVIGITSGKTFSIGMMVDATEPGSPATYTTQVLLDQFLPGEYVLIQLIEVSMADGSYMSVDSVIVKVK